MHWEIGKPVCGCPTTECRASEPKPSEKQLVILKRENLPSHDLSKNTDFTYSTDSDFENFALTPIRPYHVRLKAYKRARDKIFCQTSRQKRSAARIREFWSRRKTFNKITISAIERNGFDSRPRARLTIFGKVVVALLDSGATDSCIGGDLARDIVAQRKFRKCFTTVRTADGMRQQVVGSISIFISFNGHEHSMSFVIVPTIEEDMICGMDFWNKFGLDITENLGSALVQVCTISTLTISLTPLQQQKLKAAISAFPSFEKEGLGLTTWVEHEIDTGDAKPIKQRYYPISPAREKLLCAELDRMLKLGVIEEAGYSPWSSPGVLVVKPEKNRFCLDSRLLNEVTIKDAYPMPSLDGIIARLPPVHFISKIDLKDAFWQVPLAESSRPKTAFTVPNRPLYQFTRMPFGLCNSPQTLCRLMDKVVPYGMKTHVFVYLDDLLILSTTFDEHVVHLTEVASQLRKAGLTINVGKSHFALKEVKYLGYIVGEGTLKVDPEKVRAITEFPVPKSTRQLRQILGMLGWYRRFIHDYSTLTAPLTDLLCKNKNFAWNPEADKAFNLLKEKLSSAPLLVHPDYNREFIVQCDASQCGVGALLAQADGLGNERPIAFMSQKLNKAQRNYSVTELECLAVVLAVKKFRPYIEGHPFKVVTDHSALKWLMSQKDLSGRLARWALKLQGFDFKIEHRKGKDNIVADTLSRAFQEDTAEISALEIETLPEIDLESPAFQSEEYQQLVEKIKTSDLPDLKVVDNFVYHRTDCSSPDLDESLRWKLWVPKELQKAVIYSAHDVPSSAHCGIAKTLEKIRRHFYWPSMVTHVRDYVTACEMCKTSKPPTQSLRPPMGQMAESCRPFQRLYIDLIGPFPRSKLGNVGLLIVLDHLTKFVFLKPLRKFTTKPIIEYLEDYIFSTFGVPETIISDNGSQFKSKEFRDLMAKFGVNHMLTAVYSPQSNASERVNRSLNEALRSYLRKDQREWDRYISSINSSLRNSVHQTTGDTPYHLLFGVHMVTHGKDYKLLKNLSLLSEPSIEIRKEDRFVLLREAIKSKAEAAYLRNQKTYNLRSRDRTFEVGDEVYRRNFTQSNMAAHYNAKLAPVGVKAKIKQKLGNSYYVVEDLEGKYSATYHAKDIWK